MSEITELEPKYFVLKRNDVLRFCNELELKQLTDLRIKIDLRRKEEGKGVNSYLVLNLDDDIDLYNLFKSLELLQDRKAVHWWKNKKVNDIAVALVNAILKAKEKP